MKIPASSRNTLAACVFALAGLSLSANAATIVPISSITAFSSGDSFIPTDFSQLTNGVGIIKTDPADPSTWTQEAPTGGTTYQQEWYDHAIPAANNPTNGKQGWISFDLGSATTGLDSLYIFNSNYNGGTALGVKDINIYYATTPTVTLPSPPGANSAVDYDFTSGGWTSLTSATLAAAETKVIDLSGITSARYIAVELMTGHSGTDNRVGFDEVAITAIPEPRAALLGGLGMLMLLRRRR